MRSNLIIVSACGFVISLATPAFPQSAGEPTKALDATDVARVLVERLDLDLYKATIKGLTQFGDRRQGTDRNKAAIDWIEAQLKSYGCTNTERLKYEFGAEGPHRVAPAAAA